MRSLLFLVFAVLAGTMPVRSQDHASPSGQTDPLEAKIDKPLRAELRAIYDEDQKYRRQIDGIEKAHGRDSQQMGELWKIIDQKDAENLSKVKAILDQRGWLGPDVVGENGSAALFFVIQHADLQTQEKYLPMMRIAVKEKKAQPSDLALLEDRVALREGRNQIYGSQLGFNQKTGKYYVESLDNPDGVDSRRIAVGLPPLAEYLKHRDIIWDATEYKRNRDASDVKVDEPLRTELRAVLDEDQKDRLQIDEVKKAHGDDSPQMRELWKTIKQKDAENIVKVKAILDQRGWLGPDIVGHDGNSALFLVIQHSDLPTQQKYLPMMRVAVKQGKAQPSHLALLEDRVALGEGRPQIYGSQIGFDQKTGKPYVQLLDDPDNVDSRRAAVGLRPLADYLKNWDLTWDATEYKKQLPELEKINLKTSDASP